MNAIYQMYFLMLFYSKWKQQQNKYFPDLEVQAFNLRIYAALQGITYAFKSLGYPGQFPIL